MKSTPAIMNWISRALLKSTDVTPKFVSPADPAAR
jgi:hypothetical protein